jgi:hypothetical protein
MTNKCFITAVVRIRTSLERDALAHRISECILGGIEFDLRSPYERYEQPAVSTKQPFLGITLCLIGHDGYYSLQLEQEGRLIDALGEDPSVVELEDYLMYLLQDRLGLEVEHGAQPEGSDVEEIE